MEANESSPKGGAAQVRAPHTHLGIRPSDIGRRPRLSRYRKLPALNRMIDSLLAPRTLRDALQRLARTALASFNADGAYIEVTTGAARAHVGVGNLRPAERPLDPPRAAIAAPAVEGRLREIATSQGFPGDTRSYLGAPFAVGTELTGFVALGSMREKAFRSSERPELSAFARLGALAIAQARLRESLRRAAPNAEEATHRVEILERALDVVTDAVAITDADERLIFLNKRGRAVFDGATNGGTPPWLRLAAADEQGHPIAPERWPSRRATSEGATPLRARLGAGALKRLFVVTAHELPLNGEAAPWVMTTFREVGGNGAS